MQPSTQNSGDGNFLPPIGETDPSSPSASYLAVVGRTIILDANDPVERQFGRNGVAFGIRFSGSEATAHMSRTIRKDLTRFNVAVDGGPATTLVLDDGTCPLPLARGLTPGTHEVWWTHRTEARFTGSVQLKSIDLGADGKLLPAPTPPTRASEVIGASVDNGFGVETVDADGCDAVANQNPDLAWIKFAANQVGARAINSSVSGMGMAIDLTGTTMRTVRRVWPPADDLAPSNVGEVERAVDAVFMDLTENDWEGMGGPGLALASNRAVWQSAALDLLGLVFEAYPETRVYFLINAAQPQANRPALRTLLPDTIDKAVAAGRPARIKLLEFPFDPNAVKSCAKHPNLAGHAAMAAQADQALRQDLGW